MRSWLGNSDIKEKGTIANLCKLIESNMERFRLIEKESKVKAFSKQNLSSEEGSGPKAEAKAFLHRTIALLNGMIDKVDSDLDQYHSGNLKGKDKARGQALEQTLEHHKFMQSGLSRALQGIQDSILDPSEVDNIRQDLEDYIECHDEPDFFFDEYIFDRIDAALEGERDEFAFDDTRDSTPNTALDDLIDEDEIKMKEEENKSRQTPIPSPIPSQTPVLKPIQAPSYSQTPAAKPVKLIPIDYSESSSPSASPYPVTSTNLSGLQAKLTSISQPQQIVTQQPPAPQPVQTPVQQAPMQPQMPQNTSPVSSFISQPFVPFSNLPLPTACTQAEKDKFLLHGRTSFFDNEVIDDRRVVVIDPLEVDTQFSNEELNELLASHITQLPVHTKLRSPAWNPQYANCFGFDRYDLASKHAQLYSLFFDFTFAPNTELQQSAAKMLQYTDYRFNKKKGMWTKRCDPRNVNSDYVNEREESQTMAFYPPDWKAYTSAEKNVQYYQIDKIAGDFCE